MTESERPFYRKESCDLPRSDGSFWMRCHFMSGSHIVAVEELTCLSDEVAVEKAQLFTERTDPLERYEVWDCARVICGYLEPAAEVPLQMEKTVPSSFLSCLIRLGPTGSPRIPAVARRS